MENFLVAYDIFDKKRLPKVKKVVYSYALGGQKSALEAPLDAYNGVSGHPTRFISDTKKEDIFCNSILA